jgi:hypothetical protein
METGGICLACCGQARDVERSLEAGYLLHLVKPIAIEKLRDAIREAAPAVPAQRPAPANIRAAT